MAHEADSQPDIEPYVTEYTESFVKDDFKPALETVLEKPDEPISEVDAGYSLAIFKTIDQMYRHNKLKLNSDHLNVICTP